MVALARKTTPIATGKYDLATAREIEKIKVKQFGNAA
jgi:hypothetical protein